MHGMSISGDGFVVVLQSDGQFLPILMNTMDLAEVKSPEALTLLQLLQGIDMAGSVLPPELLHKRLCAYDERGAQFDPSEVTMQQLLLDLSPETNSIAFTLGLRIGAKDKLVEVPCESPFESIAFAMRYKSSIMATESLLYASDLDADTIVERFPLCFTLKDAQDQDLRVKRDFASRLAEVGIARPKNANTVVPKELLEKALKIAREKGDLEAELKIMRELGLEDWPEEESEEE